LPFNHSGCVSITSHPSLLAISTWGSQTSILWEVSGRL
jgi:hypothetical protein